MHYEILLKLMAAHFISDFILQPTSWVDDRNSRHFKSHKLWYHGLATALTVIILCGWSLWWIALIIGITHVIMDGLKSFRTQNTLWFILDQTAHLLIIAVLWALNSGLEMDFTVITSLYNSPKIWLYVTAILFLTWPAGMLIGHYTAPWREKLKTSAGGEQGLEKGGMHIGILERLLIFFLLLLGKFEVIGLLVAAKSLLRFNEKDRPEAKTEYLLIGTLLSVGLSLAIGFLVLSIKI